MTYAFRISALILLLFVAAAACAQPVTLEYKFKPGEVDKYRIGLELSLDMSSLAKGSGKAPPQMNIAMSMKMTQKTLAVYPDGSAKVKVTYREPVIQGLKMPPASAKAAKAMQSQSIIMTLSKRGQPLAIEGFDKLLASSGLQGVDMSKLLEASSGNLFLPEEPVEQGQSWSQNIPIPFGSSQLYMMSSLVDTNLSIWNLRTSQIRQSYSGKIDLKEMLNNILSAVSQSTKQQMPLPDLSGMSGYVGLNGQMDYYFSPQIGKLLKGVGATQAQISFTLPQSLVKQGAPASMSFGVNLRMGLTRFN